MKHGNENSSDTTNGEANDGRIPEIIRKFKILRDQELSRHRLNRLERRIANCLLDGETNDAIARRMSLSASGVKYHIKSIYRKAGCVDRAGFFRTIRNGMDGAISG